MDIETFLGQRGGIARVGALSRAGFGRREIQRALSHGLTRPGHGLVALQEHRRDFREALLLGGRLTCISAAAFHGLWPNDPPERIHVCCDHGRASGAVVHRSRRFAPHPHVPVVAVGDVVLHALGCLPKPEAIALAESALRRGARRSDLEAALTAQRLRPLLELLNQARTTADSYPEVRARLLLQEHGIPFREQVFIPGIGRVDFLVCGCLILEIDGFAYHSSREAKARDDARDNEAACLGLSVLRFLPEYVLYRPEQLIAAVRRTLSVRGFGDAAEFLPASAG
ncbi:hypothetical protein GCM10023081_31710 [Arthrobacter ginkgonis]|uniref:DUF559 domain-containing protein n=2 Tax=Arthrobacter ginkgonis TaxID=1630594 RepID=A0ABP7CJJ1_9MICC